MFRLQDKVPQVYVEKSRDFQYFCRLVDILQNGVKFDIDTMVDLLEPFSSNDRMLELLCTKVGFFPKYHYNSEILRHIISVFPYAIRNKGTVDGIVAVVNSIIKAENVTNINAPQKSYVDVYIDETGGVVVSIYASYTIENRNALNDVLSYIIPAGCSVRYGVYSIEVAGEFTKLGSDHAFTRIFGSKDTKKYQRVKNVSIVKSYNSTYDGAHPDVRRYQGALISSQVISKAIYDEPKVNPGE